MTALEVFAGSDGDLTKRYYAELEKRGPVGIVAVNLFRAQKCSTRAKVYRGGIRGVGSFKRMAYDRKNWSLECLCRVLAEHADSLGINFGWKHDPNTPGYEWILYVDIPQGQISFHSPVRFEGRDYSGDWDHTRLSADRTVQFCDYVSSLPPVNQLPLLEACL